MSKNACKIKVGKCYPRIGYTDVVQSLLKILFTFCITQCQESSRIMVTDKTALAKNNLLLLFEAGAQPQNLKNLTCQKQRNLFLKV